MEASIHSKTDYPFDYFFDKTSGTLPEVTEPLSENFDSVSEPDTESHRSQHDGEESGNSYNE